MAGDIRILHFSSDGIGDFHIVRRIYRETDGSCNQRDIETQ